ncbi:MAG TPA: immunoglobulin-like domain-containing protein [Candidatus Bathyarchaeia archaeon]
MKNISKIFLLLLVSSQINITQGRSIYIYNDVNPNDLTQWLEAEYWDWDPRQAWVSAGPHRPGDKITVEVDPNYLLNTTPYFKLIRIDEGPHVIQEYVGDTQSTNWTITLPDTIPAEYRFGVALNRVHNETLFFVRNIIVDEVRAELSLDKTEYQHDEIPKMALKNLGTASLIFGVDYWFEKYDDGEWGRVEWDTTWIAIGIELEPGGVYSKRLDHPVFTEGLYRVCKKVHIGEDYRLPGLEPVSEEVLKSEFTVTSSPGLLYYLRIITDGLLHEHIFILFLILLFIPFLLLLLYRYRARG